MSTFVLRATDRFPVGTVVSAYPSVSPVYQGAPPVPPADTATVQPDSSLTFTTLEDDHDYIAYALVAARDVYVHFRVQDKLLADPDFVVMGDGDIPVWNAGQQRFVPSSGDFAILSNAPPEAPGTPEPGTSPEAMRADAVPFDNGVYWGSGPPPNSLGGNDPSRPSYIDYTNGRIYGPKAGGVWPGTYITIGTRFDPTLIAGFVDSWEAGSLLLSPGAHVTSWMGSRGHILQAPGGSVGPVLAIDTETGIKTVQSQGGGTMGVVDQHLLCNTDLTWEHAFVVASYDGSPGDGFEGLLTGPTSDEMLSYIVSSAGFDTGPGIGYRLNGTPYAGPFPFGIGAYGCISASKAGGFTTGPQLLQDRNIGIARQWGGNVAAVFLYDSVLTGSVLASVENYLMGKYLIGAL